MPLEATTWTPGPVQLDKGDIPLGCPSLRFTHTPGCSRSGNPAENALQVLQFT